VRIEGEVRFPGVYPIREGERLSDLILRAGGFTDEAYLYAAVFTRKAIQEEQQKALEEMAAQVQVEIARMQTELAGITAQHELARKQAALETAKQVLAKLQKAKATGRLVIRLMPPEKLRGTPYDLVLRDGDRLYVPKRPDAVLVLGQVYNTNAQLYDPKLDLWDYIERAGGLTRLADKEHIYVLHANGEVEPAKKRWSTAKIRPGDAIIVPQDVERVNLVSAALDWTKVFYQLGIALASMKTVGLLP